MSKVFVIDSYKLGAETSFDICGVRQGVSDYESQSNSSE